jgi:hypothetical protein
MNEITRELDNMSESVSGSLKLLKKLQEREFSIEVEKLKET